MPYSYDDFLSAATSSGLLGEFSQADLETAKKYPEFGLSILSLKRDYHDAATDEQKLLANEAANQLRSSYGNYMGGSDGGSYYSQGKIPGQIDAILDQINNYGSFSFDQEAPVYDNQYAEQQQALLDAILNREDFSWSKGPAVVLLQEILPAGGRPGDRERPGPGVGGQRRESVHRGHHGGNTGRGLLCHPTERHHSDALPAGL